MIRLKIGQVYDTLPKGTKKMHYYEELISLFKVDQALSTSSLSTAK